MSTQTGIRVAATHWLLFCKYVAHRDHILLHGHLLPTQDRVQRAEADLLVFATWLRRSYSAATVATYITGVKAAHFAWAGVVSFRDLGVSFARVSLLLKILQRDQPTQRRIKVPFTLAHFERLLPVVMREWVSGSYDVMRFWAMITLAFQQLLRLNEIGNVQSESLANRHPMMVGHLSFRSSEGGELAHPTSVAMAAQNLRSLHHAILKMPPSKADPFACNHPLYLPLGRMEKARFSPCWNLWFMVATHPVDPTVADQVPLFQASVSGVPRSTPPFTQVKAAVFWSDFKRFCRLADVQYSQFGTHAFRVGGMNALQDAGVGGPEIMAMGRWASDCFTHYSRRQRLQLMKISERMFG
jgi:hypothetical protein